ncbi:MAG: restriction endonuclease subunit S [Candidatus Thiodiazotropha endolucinida]
MKFRPLEELFESPLRNGLTKPKKVRGEGYKMVNMGELFSYHRIKNIPMDRVPLTEKEKATSLLEPGDLLFARQSLVRKGAGQCSIFLTDDEEVCFESHLIRCRLNKDIANPLFYYYYFASRPGKLVIDAIIEQGAGAAGIRGSDLAKVLVPDIEKNAQDEVANIFDQIDSKIELNHHTSQTLEQIAQAIFKSWFVDFDPVRAKIAAREDFIQQYPEVTEEAIRAAAGTEGDTLAHACTKACELAAICAISGKTEEQLKELDAGTLQQLKAVAALFPDALVDSPHGETPKGWKVSSIGDEVEVLGGGTPSTKNERYWEGGEINWTSPRDLSGAKDKVLIKTEKQITEAGLSKISSGLLPVDTVLMSSRAPVGYLALAKIPLAINQGYIAMKCNKQLTPEFVLLWVDSMMDDIKQRASGSTFAEISKKNFRPLLVVVPDSRVLDIFHTKAKPIFDKITESVFESLTLIETRDTLLPKLLSGKIVV